MCDLSSLIRANFTDGDEYPVLHRQSSDIVLPFQMIRFTDRKDASLNDTIVFYEWDRSFVQKLDDDHLEKVIPSCVMQDQWFNRIIVSMRMNR